MYKDTLEDVWMRELQDGELWYFLFCSWIHIYKTITTLWSLSNQHFLSSSVLPWPGSGWCSWWPCAGVRPVWAAAWVPSPNPGPWCSNPVWHGRRSCWSQWHSHVALRRGKRSHEHNVCHMFMFRQRASYRLFEWNTIKATVMCTF